MAKRLVLSIVLFLIILIIPKSTFAANEFKTDYNVSYDIGLDGVTQVTEKITLTNLTETFYASTFLLTIGATSLSDVSAIDKQGDMGATVEVKDNKSVVSLKFNEQITGIGKTQAFVLKYRSKDFVEKIGKNWEVNLPRIHEGTDVESYNLNLAVPFAFGEPTVIVPKPKSESDGSGKLTINFTKEQLANSGVSVRFGSTQVFDYSLKYSLNNSSFLPNVSFITLPMDTNYQNVLISSITPQPLNVTIDSDGNYRAWYQVEKRSTLEIAVKGQVELLINPKSNFSKLQKSEISNLTKSDKFWEKDNPSMKATIAEIFKKGQPKTTQEKAKLIYAYVVSTLKFNSNKSSSLPRLGAFTTLSNIDKASAEEFTDLFITLSRADGIPARELVGYANSNNKQLRPLSVISDVLHTWPEYYDEQQGWVMIDPTWEQTSGGVDYFSKLDLNHFVLNIRGNSSELPVSITTVEIKASEGEFNILIKPDVQIEINNNIWSGLPGTVTIKILNSGNALIPTNSLSINSDKINILNSKNILISSIPPAGFTSFKINFRAPFLKQSDKDEIVIDYMGQRYIKEVKIEPFFVLQLFPYLFIFLTVLVVGLYSLVLGIHHHKNKK
ncbi:MAG: transglutaminase-like domain-containing protein [Candidatus Daviesbacteria bacterium]|nr:transglutaminase-like domain-containing protein [Candidatus Daviesbacteria bacterium]